MSEEKIGSPDKSHMSLGDMELAVIDEMCEWFVSGDNENVLVDSLPHDFGVDKNRAHSLFIRLKALGAIEEYELVGATAERAAIKSFRVSGNICEVAARERAARNPKVDIVERLYRQARTHPIVAWLLVGFFVLTAAVTLVNQGLQIREKLTVDAPPAAPTDEAN